MTRDSGDPVTGDMVWVTIAPLSLLSLSSLFQLTSASLVAGNTKENGRSEKPFLALKGYEPKKAKTAVDSLLPLSAFTY